MIANGSHRLALAVATGYAGFCGLVAWRWRRRRSPAPGQGILVASASQTGFAEQLAQGAATALRTAGRPVRWSSLRHVDAAQLRRTECALFLVSTTGDGEAPDDAAAFERRAMREGMDFSGLRYGLLALGDRRYPGFCAFGRRLDDWLRGCGATPIFERIEVDDGDPASVGRWHASLASLGGQPAAPAPAPAETPWRLVERRLLNPGSQGQAVYHLALEPPGDMPDWSAGDIAVIAPRHDASMVDEVLAKLGRAGDTALAEALATRRLPADPAEAGLDPALLPPLPMRDYSIASLPADGRLELLVRRARHPDGRLGLGSGWLTAHAREGAEVMLRLRRHPAFHAPPDGRPLLLVGNGTGLAGLRAHLKARVAAGHRRNWLVFGERNRAHDYFHATEIEAWRAAGMIEHLDLAFSRDQPHRVHVQDLLRAQAGRVRAWAGQGAAILVCGSLQGMAGGVDDALADILGAAALAAMREEGRYRRDVY